MSEKQRWRVTAPPDQEEGQGWRPVKDRPLVVLVGLTGVGKSTVLAALLARLGSEVMLLPDRRTLTDKVLIPAAQADLQQPLTPVTDRAERFRLTAHYRTLHPGGMAEAAAGLWVRDESNPAGLAIFDGLRGAAELDFAVSHLPHARFIALTAPDGVRLQRLLQRGDAFDRIASPAATASMAFTFPPDTDFIDEAIKNELLQAVHQGDITPADLQAKLKIVQSERTHYNAEDTVEVLQNRAAARSLIIDTTAHPAAEVARRAVEWIDLWRFPNQPS